MSRRIHALPTRPLAIRHGDVLLTVPTMHPATPPAVRVQVFELVLRRLYGEAADVAAAAADEATHRGAGASRLAALMAQTPHKNARGYAAAA